MMLIGLEISREIIGNYGMGGNKILLPLKISVE